MSDAKKKNESKNRLPPPAKWSAEEWSHLTLEVEKHIFKRISIIFGILLAIGGGTVYFLIKEITDNQVEIFMKGEEAKGIIESKTESEVALATLLLETRELFSREWYGPTEKEAISSQLLDYYTPLASERKDPELSYTIALLNYTSNYLVEKNVKLKEADKKKLRRTRNEEILKQLSDAKKYLEESKWDETRKKHMLYKIYLFMAFTHQSMWKKNVDPLGEEHKNYAIELYKKAIKNYFYDKRARYRLALIYRENQDYVEAIKKSEEVIGLLRTHGYSPMYCIANYNMACYLTLQLEKNNTEPNPENTREIFDYLRKSLYYPLLHDYVFGVKNSGDTFAELRDKLLEAFFQNSQSNKNLELRENLEGFLDLLWMEIKKASDVVTVEKDPDLELLRSSENENTKKLWDELSLVSELFRKDLIDNIQYHLSKHYNEGYIRKKIEQYENERITRGRPEVMNRLKGEIQAFLVPIEKLFE